LPSTNWRTIAASSIHGTGDQNFPIAVRKGCTYVSGMAFGPDLASRARASPELRPPGAGALPAAVSLGAEAGAARVVSLMRLAPEPGCCPCRYQARS